MKDTVDIDSLLEEINSISSTNNGKGKKNNKKKEEITPKPITTSQIVQTYEAIKLGNPSQVEKNIQDIINPDQEKEAQEDSFVEIVDTETNKIVHTVDPECKKKKKKKKKKPANGECKIDGEKDVTTNVEEKINKYKHLFDFSDKEITNTRFQDNSVFRVLKNWEDKPWNQTNYPTKSIEEQFKNQEYPAGEIKDYGGSGIWRSTSEEKKELDRLGLYDLKSMRKAAECHRQVRKFAQQIIRPGKRLIDVCDQIENMNRYLINQTGLECGIGFPTGCSLNNVAAHYTPNPGDFRTIEKNDVCKIDFGTHVNGLIIDCAFTVAFDPQFDDLLLAVQDATDTGLKEAGIDVRLGDVGAAIQEVMESYEVIINGKTYPVKSVKNLCGHTIEAYKIHAGKSVPIVKRNDNTKMEEGELYAIETFGSTGKGYVWEDADCSHYMRDYYAFNGAKLKHDKAKALFNHIQKQYTTLPFCRKWLEAEGFTNHSLSLKYLVDAGLVNPYPPLSDVAGCYVAQFEHSVFLRPNCKEVLSRGDDF